MRVGIVVHSETGHTILLARVVADKLRKAGHDVDISLLRARTKIKPGMHKVELRKVPDALSFDILLIGGPVWAFNSSPAVSAYLDTIKDDSLENRLCLSFVTMGLPLHVLNGNRALGEMEKKLARKGGRVLAGHAMHWFVHADKAAIEHAASTIFKRIEDQCESPPSPQEQSPEPAREQKPPELSSDTTLE